MLSPEQVQQMRQKYKVAPIASGDTSNRVAELDSAWATPADTLKKTIGMGESPATNKSLASFMGPKISTINPSIKDYGSRVADDMASTYKEAGEDVTKHAATIVGPKKEGDSFSMDLARRLAAAGHISGDIAGTAFAPILNMVKEAIPQGIANDAKKAVDWAADKITNNPQILEALQKVNKTFDENPDLKKALTSDLPNALSLLGAEKAGPLNPELKASDAINAVKSVVSDVATPAIKGAGSMLAGTGRATKALGEAGYQSAITPNVQEAERILDYKAKTPFLERVKTAISGESEAPRTRAITAAEKGVMGTETGVGVGAKRASTELWKNDIGPAIDNAEGTMSKSELFAPAEERVYNITDPSKKIAYRNALDALKEEYKYFPNEIPIKKAQLLKEDLAEFTPAKVYRGQDVANETRMLKADMAGGIRKKVYEALGEGTREKYLDYGNLRELESVGVKAITGAASKGGFGSFWSHAWDMATIPIKTVGGQVLYRVGNALEFLGEKGLRSFGEFLEKKGFEKPSVGDFANEGAGQANGPVANENGQKNTHITDSTTETLNEQEVGTTYKLTTNPTTGRVEIDKNQAVPETDNAMEMGTYKLKEDPKTKRINVTNYRKPGVNFYNKTKKK